MNCRWGYYLQAGKLYDGYVYARVVSSAKAAGAVTVSAELVQTDPDNHTRTLAGATPGGSRL